MSNPYNLDVDAQTEADGIIMQINVKYDIDADSMQTHVLERNDVASDELRVRVAHNVESALRRFVPTYGEEMELIEQLAKVVDDVPEDTLVAKP